MKKVEYMISCRMCGSCHIIHETTKDKCSECGYSKTLKQRRLNEVE